MASDSRFDANRRWQDGVALSRSGPGPSPLKLGTEVVYFGAPGVILNVVRGFMRGWPLVTAIELVASSLARSVQPRSEQR
jgi:hypothetical protein